ncbi:hypothetical protein BMS3Abin07_02410 [bacterium BMS3Abin07]|nr:hypothetical protein BMS3Abin07_02410 [bacterium BMS3Abin07]GBE31435.1 hypothetical protein BMS3Bbin05_00335 [bacterium BMS3Bbin05]
MKQHLTGFFTVFWAAILFVTSAFACLDKALWINLLFIVINRNIIPVNNSMEYSIPEDSFKSEGSPRS